MYIVYNCQDGKQDFFSILPLDKTRANRTSKKYYPEILEGALAGLIRKDILTNSFLSEIIYIWQSLQSIIQASIQCCW